MKNNILEYKGYHTRVEYDAVDFVIRGKIEGINDFVEFECEDLKAVELEFHQAVDDYLEFCAEVGKTPEKEYKGSFNVRISPELHKKLAIMASKNGESLNCSVEKAIEQYVSGSRILAEGYQETIKVLAEALQTGSRCRNDNVLYKVEDEMFSSVGSINITYGEDGILS